MSTVLMYMIHKIPFRNFSFKPYITKLLQLQVSKEIIDIELLLLILKKI